MTLLQSNPTVLAPMAGFTDSAFRSICKSFNCGLTVTEMVSAMALLQGNSQTRELLNKEPNDTNCAVQIFGHDPVVMRQSVEVLKPYNFSAIDINMGCPVKKIVSNGDGSALLENPALAGKIVLSVKSVSNVAVMAKIRLGVSDSKNTVDFVKMLEANGADAVTVHFRTRVQMYGGQADYSLLETIASAVKIPIIANGDISTRQKMLEVLGLGAAAVAVGRSALGNPKIFCQLTENDCEFDILQTLTHQMQLMSKHKSQRIVLNEMKKHIAYYLKGLRGAKAAVVKIMTAKTIDQQLKIVETFLKENEKC